MFVCLLVCWSAFYRPHDICPLCGAASEWPREQEPSRAAKARAGKRIHSESTRAHAVQLLNEKIAALMPFKNFSNRTESYSSQIEFAGSHGIICNFTLILISH